MPGPFKRREGGGWRSRKYDGSWRLSLLQSSVLILACERVRGKEGTILGNNVPLSDAQGRM